MEYSNAEETFQYNPGSRPRGTSEVGSSWVIHYTCNAPSLTALKDNGIIPIGETYGVKDREVVLIPKGMFTDLGVKHLEP